MPKILVGFSDKTISMIFAFSDSDNFERDDTQASLSFEEIASHLPYNFVNERRA